MDLAQAANELYGLPPGDFVAARTALAKQAEADRALAAEIRRLPKPSVAAYVVNQLVRRHHEEVEQLIELGDALRQAQVGLDGAELRKLDQQRRQLTRAVAERGRGLAVDQGTSVSVAAAAQVDETLHAAMADPEAADAVRTGRLARALSATGFGPVDVSDAVAVPAALASVTSLTDKRRAAAAREAQRALISARSELVAAERTAEEARKAAAAARRDADAVADRRAELKETVRRLRGELETAERDLDQARSDQKAARKAADAAARDSADAAAARDATAATLARLTADAERADDQP